MGRRYRRNNKRRRPPMPFLGRVGPPEKDPVVQSDVVDDDESNYNQDYCQHEESQPKLNPLLLDVVVRNLFRHVPVAEWGTFRQVCRTWWKAPFGLWRKYKPITLNARHNGRPVGKDNFLLFWNEECNETPFQSLSIRNFTLLTTDVPERENNPDICSRRIWQPVGSVVTRLSLFNCQSFPDRGILPILVDDFPALTHLTIVYCSFSKDLHYAADNPLRHRVPASPHHRLENLKVWSGVSEYPGLWRSPGFSYFEIFSTFPNIKFLNIGSGEMYDETISVLKNVARVRGTHAGSIPISVIKTESPVVFTEVRDVTFDETMSEDDSDDYIDDEAAERRNREPCYKILPLLRSLKIRLEHIHVCSSMSLLTVPELIEFNSRCLRTLYIDARIRTVNHVPLVFPENVQLDNLEQLGIGVNVCSSLRLITQMKNLKQLFVTTASRSRKETFEPNLISSITDVDSINVKLEYLHRLEISFEVSVPELQLMAHWFPNLRHLSMPLNDDQFPIVCEKWNKLISLQVIGKRLTDFGLLGFRGRNSQKLVSHISKLTSLEEFIAKGAILSKPSVKYGFLQMSSLKWIDCPFLSSVNRTLLAELQEKYVHLVHEMATEQLLWMMHLGLYKPNGRIIRIYNDRRN